MLTMSLVSHTPTWSLVEGTEIANLQNLEKQPIQTSSYKDTVAVITDGELSLYSASGKLEKSVKLSFTPSAVSISAKYVIVANAATFELKIFDSSLSPVSKALEPKPRSKVTALEVSPNGKYLAAGDSTGKINLYDLEEFSIVTSRWSFHTSKINTIDWNTDNEHVVSSSLDTNLIVYSVSRPARTIKALNTHKEGVNGAVWLNEDEIASVGTDACLKFWKVTFSQ
ncbi:unnamed protein product [Ambrosiozyma monospora]|uniref:Unnamed protein product n=1 Tax=Ambrosiozyma monospora TaxID=43982 RepID=A0A9W6Z5D3_AMBMO|nr:unnamed protein product [Ambrosiozyma monospora]